MFCSLSHFLPLDRPICPTYSLSVVYFSQSPLFLLIQLELFNEEIARCNDACIPTCKFDSSYHHIYANTWLTMTRISLIMFFSATLSFHRQSFISSPRKSCYYYLFYVDVLFVVDIRSVARAFENSRNRSLMLSDHTTMRSIDYNSTEADWMTSPTGFVNSVGPTSDIFSHNLAVIIAACILLTVLLLVAARFMVRQFHCKELCGTWNY